MPLYENVFIVRQDASAARVDELTERFSGIIEQHGGKIMKKENWGLRSLAYRMDKNRKGRYVMMNIDAPADALKEMERQMRFDEDIVRYLSVRVEELEADPSAMMTAKNTKEPARGGKGFKRDDAFSAGFEEEEIYV